MIAWLIGIICIILIIRFWRIFLPLILAAAVIIGAFWTYQNNQSKRREEQSARQAQSLRKQLTATTSVVGGQAREWSVQTERDPASGRNIPRTAAVLSDNGLCRLQVEERIDATKLTGIYCYEGLKVRSSYLEDIQVKFDNRETSDTLQIKRFSNGSDVYIDSRQNAASYREFLTRLASGERVALQLPFDDVGDHWVSFSLKGAGPALSGIGAMATSIAPKPRSLVRSTTLEKPSSPQPESESPTPRWSQYGTWLRLSKGMAAQSITEILGEPERKMTVGREQVWYYGGGRYRVFMSDDGKLDRWTD